MNSIVVAYDGSEPARRALERVAEIAATRDVAVTVVSAVDVHGSGAIGRSAGAIDSDEAAERNREVVEAEEILAKHGIKAHGLEAIGEPADAILAAAKESGADLIVLGTRGLNLAKRVVLGSVSTEIVHKAHCDVLVVR